MKNKATQTIVFAALLLTLAVVLKIFGIPVSLFGGLAKDINLSPVIILYSGMVLGPVYGGLIGGATDLLVFLIRPLGGYFPLFTITNALMGILPGLFFQKGHRNFKFVKILLVTLLTQTVCSFVLNTLTLIYLGMPPQVAWLRATTTYIFVPVYAALIFVLTKYSLRLFRGTPLAVQNE